MSVAPSEDELTAGLRAPRSTTRLDPCVLHDLDADVPTLNSAIKVANGGLDVDFAAKLQRSLQRECEREGPGQRCQQASLDGDTYEYDALARDPCGAQPPRSTLQSGSEMWPGLGVDEDPMQVAAPSSMMTGSLQQIAVSEQVHSGPLCGSDLQRQLLAKLRPDLPPDAITGDEIKDALLSGELETSLKRKLAALSEAEADENFETAEGIRAPKSTVLLSKADIDGLDDEAYGRENFADDHGSARFKEDLQQALLAKLSDNWQPAAALAPPTDHQPLGVSAQEVASQTVWSKRLAGLSKERLQYENAALRAEVEALRFAIQRRRAELVDVLPSR